MNPEDPQRHELAKQGVEVVQDETVPVGLVRFRGHLVTPAQAQREIEKARRRQARAMRSSMSDGIELDDMFVAHRPIASSGRRKQAELRERARARKRNKQRRRGR